MGWQDWLSVTLGALVTPLAVVLRAGIRGRFLCVWHRVSTLCVSFIVTLSPEL